MRIPAILCAVALAIASLLYACKQGEGDFCQINSDCEAPLQCNAGTERCQLPGAGQEVDAAPPADAALPPDAAPLDAGPDAAPDAAAAPAVR